MNQMNLQLFKTVMNLVHERLKQIPVQKTESMQITLPFGLNGTLEVSCSKYVVHIEFVPVSWDEHITTSLITVKKVGQIG